MTRIKSHVWRRTIVDWTGDWREWSCRRSTLLRLHVLHMLHTAHSRVLSQYRSIRFAAIDEDRPSTAGVFEILNNNIVFKRGNENAHAASRVRIDHFVPQLFLFHVHNDVSHRSPNPVVAVSLFSPLRLPLYRGDRWISKSNVFEFCFTSEFRRLSYLAPGTIRTNIKLYAIQGDRSSYRKEVEFIWTTPNCRE